ncbi:hypothetical protein GCM10011506_04370 [Marivirga lumbricoides]|uniref:Beta-lactamase-related domain-containing protein n=1 Tax=Marivirga lumbricoides TaxID=1046115 RepID=A0ABQ1LDQ7_9BACT|nr:hypothetical protein GCM10011506_04370 [Marivirga lumbricoides]
MMKSKALTSCWFGVYLLFTSTLLSAQTPVDFENSLSEYLEIQHEKMGFNGIVVVSTGEGIMVEKKVGLASRELDVPVQSHSKFKIASMTKSFTALLVALAIQEGKLKMEDALFQYFPDLTQEKWKEITIKQLMSHTSGIPHWAGFDQYWTEKSFLPLSLEQILGEIFKMELLFQPGSQFSYSSPTYYLLATILEKIYSESFDNLLKEKILQKLNLNESGTCNGLSIIPDMASGYHLVADDSVIVAPPRNMNTLKGAGNMYASAQDITTWCRSFLSDDYWGQTILTQTFSPLTTFNSTEKEGALYGQGWYLTEEKNDIPTNYHISGGTYGFSSAASIYPTNKFSIVILSNMSFLPVDQLRRDIEKIVFGLPFKMPEKYEKSVALADEQLQKLAGNYLAENGMLLKVFTHQGNLYAKLGGHPPFALMAKNELSFYSSKIDILLMFQMNEAAKIKGLEAQGRGRVDYFEKQ